MRNEANEVISSIVIAALCDVKAGRFRQALSRVESLDNTSYLLGDPNEYFWVTWSATHFSLYSLLATSKKFNIPPAALERINEKLEEAEGLIRRGCSTNEVPIIYKALELLSASAGDLLHEANFSDFPEKGE